MTDTKKKAKKGFLDGYETYEGPRGNESEWRESFFDRMGFEKAVEVLGAEDPMVLFGLTGKSTWADVKKAYRRLAILNHPDRGGSVETMKKINAAYEVLEARFSH